MLLVLCIVRAAFCLLQLRQKSAATKGSGAFEIVVTSE